MGVHSPFRLQFSAAWIQSCGLYSRKQMFELLSLGLTEARIALGKYGGLRIYRVYCLVCWCWRELENL